MQSGVGSGHFKFLTSLDAPLQNFLHIPIFGLLAYLWLKSLAKLSISAWAKIIITLIISIFYGILDEIHQLFVPGRYCSLMDIVLNLFGVIAGIVLFFLLRRFRIQEKHH